MEIFTCFSLAKEASSNTRTSSALGNEILRESSVNVKTRNRGMKFANFQVLREMISLCPAILIEVGFLNNPDEASHFSNPSGIRSMALVILSGINNHIKTAL
ncbi:N-acetylmuramoyl-L-alanine amidase family protein [Autumnicola patrickiae]|uniref:N-acetylmuramoyl-L-alanine amidase family protein n=1 Tax=Autumnicola patrickiae TaxID=3075591 RepID=UPI0032C24639